MHQPLSRRRYWIEKVEIGDATLTAKSTQGARKPSVIRLPAAVQRNEIESATLRPGREKPRLKVS